MAAITKVGNHWKVKDADDKVTYYPIDNTVIKVNGDDIVLDVIGSAIKFRTLYSNITAPAGADSEAKADNIVGLT